MKILHLTSHMNVGGITTYVMGLSARLKKKGIEVCCASAGGTLVDELEGSGVRHFEIPVRTKNFLHIKILFALFKVIEIIDAEEITHLHAHTRVTQVLAMFVSRFRDVHVVTTCHGFYRPKLFRRLIPAWGERVIAISDPVREHLVNDFKVKKGKISLVYNGVEPKDLDVKLSDFDKQELRRYFNIGPKGMIVGGVSRLAKVKGYQHLIDAIPMILDRHPETKFVLVGYGDYADKLKKQAMELGVDERIVFTGKVEDVGVVQQLIDVFVHPAIWQEGFGLAILEAMAAGKPIVASNTGGVYALVKENFNGWLINPGDAEAIAGSVIKLLDNPELISTFGEHSRKVACEEFSVDRMANGILDVYKMVSASEEDSE